MTWMPASACRLVSLAFSATKSAAASCRSSCASSERGVTSTVSASRPVPRRETPVRFLGGVGPRRAERLESEGFRTAGDLLLHLPIRYEDRRRIVAPHEVDAPGRWTIAGRLEELRLIRTRRRGFVLVRGRVVGERGALAVRWFNQPYLLQRWADGAQVVAHGEVRAADLVSLELVNPSLRLNDPNDPKGPNGARASDVLPIYPSIAGFGPAPTAALVARALGALDVDPPPETLPKALRERYRFPSLADALRAVHAPPADADLALYDRRASPAHLRLIYEELLALQLELAELRRDELREEKPHRYAIDDRVRARSFSCSKRKRCASRTRW